MPRPSAPGDSRCTFSKTPFFFDINVLILRQATAESTDYDPGKVLMGSIAKQSGLPHGSDGSGASGISKKISKNILFQVEIFRMKNEYSCEYSGLPESMQ